MASKIDKDLEYITKLISGEKALEKRKKKLKKLKEEAIKHQKEEKRRKVVEKEAKIEDDGTAPKKVVQNIKLFEWEAPDRYEFAFDSKEFTIIVAISLVLILFLAIVGKFFLMAALIALLFFIYVLGTTKPMVINHKITAKGIDYSDKLYEWFLFTDFYFTKRQKQNFLIVNTQLRFPSTLILLLDEKDRLPIFLLLQEFVLYKDIRKQGKLEKMNFGEYIELEKV